MRNYVLFCMCGRVHFMDYSKVASICDDGKEVLHICNNCGSVRLIGLDEYMNGKAWYSYPVIGREIEDLSKLGLVVASSGDKVMMATGGEATYNGGDFMDTETPKPDDVNNKEWEVLRRTVDTKKTIQCIKDRDKLKDLSGYVTNIDWNGTRYSHK